MSRALAIAIMLTMPVCAYANDEGLAIIKDLGTKWQTAYNNGDAKGVARLYAVDAVFSSGVLGNLKSTAEIETAVANQMKKTPKITVTPIEGHLIGVTAFGFGDFTFTNGPSGHYGFTAINDDGWYIAMHVSNVTPK